MSTISVSSENDYSSIRDLELTTNKVRLTLAQEEAAEMAKMAVAESQQAESTQTPQQESAQDADTAIFAI